MLHRLYIKLFLINMIDNMKEKKAIGNNKIETNQTPSENGSSPNKKRKLNKSNKPSKTLDCANKSTVSEKSNSITEEINLSDVSEDKQIIRVRQTNSTINCIHDIDSKKIFKNDEQENEFNLEKNEINKKNKIIEWSPNKRFAMFDEKIGEGQFKKVFRGYDYDYGREIAWNIITLVDMTEDEVTKLEKEINILKKFKHERILSYISGWFDENKNDVVFITELFTGGSLKQYLTKVGYPRIRVIKQWIVEILSGLNFLHEKNIIHRDIKCDNVFINSNDGHIKIGDLGFSCILKKDNTAKSLSGTPEFMAPEVLKGKYGIAADIYSFGLCLLEISTLERPYKECSSVAHIFEKLKSGDFPKSLEKIKNLHMREFIKLCLKDELDRPSASELLEESFLTEMTSEENNHTAVESQDYLLSNLNLNDYNQRKKKKKHINKMEKQFSKGSRILNKIMANTIKDDEESKHILDDEQYKLNNQGYYTESSMCNSTTNLDQQSNFFNFNKDPKKCYKQPSSFFTIHVSEGDKSNKLNIIKIIIIVDNLKYKQNTNESLKIEFDFDLDVDNSNIILNELETEGIITLEEERCELFQKLKGFLEPRKNEYQQIKDFNDCFRSLNTFASQITQSYSNNYSLIKHKTDLTTNDIDFLAKYESLLKLLSNEV